MSEYKHDDTLMFCIVINKWWTIAGLCLNIDISFIRKTHQNFKFERSAKWHFWWINFIRGHFRSVLFYHKFIRYVKEIFVWVTDIVRNGRLTNRPKAVCCNRLKKLFLRKNIHLGNDYFHLNFFFWVLTSLKIGNLLNCISISYQSNYT